MAPYAVTREIYHFRNLSRGLLCPCQTTRPHLIRIQSTRCEQKDWERIIHEVGAELLYTLAKGNIAMVHDVSERDRETRACWQGLSWIRYATFRTWYPDNEKVPDEKSRTGHPLNPYWEEQFKRLSRPTRHLLRYYKQYIDKPQNSIYLRSCWSRGGGRMVEGALTAEQELARYYDALERASQEGLVVT